MRYLSAERMTKDDAGRHFTNQVGEIVYDAKTIYGPWATMTQETYDQIGTGQLGIGFGQKYKRDENGHLNCVEGGVK